MNELPNGTVASGACREWRVVGLLSNNVGCTFASWTQKNEVTVSIALLGGELLENAANRGITQAAQLGWGRP
jgi:hypothetical protein